MYRITLLSLLSLAAFFFAAGSAPSAGQVPNARCNRYDCAGGYTICIWTGERIRCCKLTQGPPGNTACMSSTTTCFSGNTVTTCTGTWTDNGAGCAADITDC